VNSGDFWKWVGVTVLAILAVRLVLWLLGVLSSLLMTAVWIAVAVGIVWILFNVLTKKKSY
jgi:hypothetical protein